MGKAPTTRLEGQVELHALLKRIEAEARPHFGVRLQPCTTAGLVLVPNGDSLTWDTYELGDVTTVDAVAARLWTRYGDDISAARYSLNGRWHTFTDAEEARILQALG